MLEQQNNAANSLTHTKCSCRYCVVLATKYRREVFFFAENRLDIREILRMLCQWRVGWKS